MKKIFLTLAITITSYCSYAQYLPLTAGSGNPLTGDLHIDGTNGNRLIFSYGGVSNNKVLLGSTYSIFGAGSKDDFLTYVRDSNPYSIWTNNVQRVTVDGGGNVGIGTSSPAAGLQIHNNVGYIDNANNQLVLSNSGYRNSETGTLNPDNAGMAFYFTNYASGVRTYDRTLDIRVRGASDGTFGAGMIRFFANDYTSGSAEREIMRIHGNGNVGIGTTNPGAKLVINSGELTINANTGLAQGGESFRAHNQTDGNLLIGNPNVTITGGTNLVSINDAGNAIYPMQIRANPLIITDGSLAIGTTDPKGYKLAVAGNAVAESMTVDLQANWPDYVFKKDYSLTPLAEVKTYIDKNQHLPGVPTAEQVAKTGINLGEMNALLVKKVEELTLYLMEKDKEDKTRQKEVDELKKQVQLLLKASQKANNN